MKKLKFLFVFLFIIAAISSCEKGGRLSVEMREDVPYLGDAIPIFESGNVNCEEVVLPEGLIRVEPYTTGRINYLGDGEFDESWPSGLVVTVSDDKFVDFYLTDETPYCIGAVIVKGGNGAMIYTYTSGIRGDVGLTSPINASGDPADLSNLTFCFVECKIKEPVVIAVKSFYWANPENYALQKRSWAASSGDFIYNTSDWCRYLGINYYPETDIIPMLDWETRENVGTVTIVEEVNFLRVTVTIKEGGIMDYTHLYVGDLQGISMICPDHANWPWKDETNQSTHTFIIPY